VTSETLSRLCDALKRHDAFGVDAFFTANEAKLLRQLWLTNDHCFVMREVFNREGADALEFLLALDQDLRQPLLDRLLIASVEHRNEALLKHLSSSGKTFSCDLLRHVMQLADKAKFSFAKHLDSTLVKNLKLSGGGISGSGLPHLIKLGCGKWFLVIRHTQWRIDFARFVIWSRSGTMCLWVWRCVRGSTSEP
jgi:hypothetical protein